MGKESESFTPGPWEHDSDGHIYQEPSEAVASGDEADAHIAKVNMGREGAQGNLRLIAATPDLLTALQRVLSSDRWTKADLDKETDADYDAEKAAKTAIAKAIGGA